eukprot:4883141-Prymnesium_polylepis.1
MWSLSAPETPPVNFWSFGKKEGEHRARKYRYTNGPETGQIGVISGPADHGPWHSPCQALIVFGSRLGAPGHIPFSGFVAPVPSSQAKARAAAKARYAWANAEIRGIFIGTAREPDKASAHCYERHGSRRCVCACNVRTDMES